MESVLARLPRPRRVAVLRLRSLGDCVLTTPALQILKRSVPDARVAVVVEDRFRAVFEDHPDVDEILPPSLGALRKFRPGLCLNLHGGTRSAWMTALSGARFRVGFGHYRHQAAYNVRIPRAQEILRVDRKVHTAEHLASAIFYLGAEPCDIPPAKLGVPAGVAQGERFAVLHAIAATPEKTWPAANFRQVAESLRNSGVEPVFIGAPSDDLSAFDGYRSNRTPLAETKRLLSQAALFLGNDSGPAHMAAAFGVPSVVIFGASDPEIWGPWRTPSQVLPMQASAGDAMDALSRLRVHA